MPPHTGITERLSRGLSGRYRVERELGRGGMAIVYLAADDKHRRPVAIKVLRPEIASSIGAARFIREIEIAAQLNHPHILPLYDSGELEGLLYYVMPFVTGESLRERLDREGQVSLHDTVGIGAEVAGALAYAHARDIVHRDIKPENILLSEGYALVADFGIARAITVAEDSGPVTTAGITVGTPLYMSPEQAMAEPLDGRSDQYSLGCVLYEMLTGRPPFGGTTAQAILAKHTLDPVPSIRAVRGDVPVALEQVITMSLAKQPAERHGNAEAFQSALMGTITGDVVTRRVASPDSPKRIRRRRLAVLGALTVVALVLGTVLSRRPRAVPVRPQSPSVAVIPFTGAPGAPGANQRDYYVEGFTEDLIDALRRIPGLKVAPATSSFQAVRVSRDARSIGRQLGVTDLIEGFVTRGAGRVKVEARILSAATGDTLFRLHFDTLERRDLDMESQIAGGIARALQVSLSATVPPSRRPTDDPVALDLYRQGRFAYEQRDQASLERAIRLFGQAIQRDSNFALAYSGVSDAYSFMAAFIYGRPARYFPQARDAALHAVEKDSMLAEAQTSLGFVSLFWDWDPAEALRHLDRAIALDSDLTRAHLFRSHVFLAIHQPDSAVVSMRRAQALEPYSQIVGTRLSSALYFDGRYEEAAQEAARVLAVDTTYALVVPDLLRAYLKLGRCADALRIARRATWSSYSVVRVMTGVAAARCGEPALARRILGELEDDRRRGRYVPHYDLAELHVALGELDQAFAEFNQAVNDRDFFMFGVTWEPMFESLRTDPRFVALANRIPLNDKD